MRKDKRAAELKQKLWDDTNSTANGLARKEELAGLSKKSGRESASANPKR